LGRPADTALSRGVARGGMTKGMTGSKGVTGHVLLALLELEAPTPFATWSRRGRLLAEGPC